MKVIVYSTHKFERAFLEKANHLRHDLKLLEARLTEHTASLAAGHDGVCLFVNDDAGEAVLKLLANDGIRFIFLRSAGFNNVNLPAAKNLGIRVARVPAYSPYAVAEHAVALMLALNRKLIRSHNRVMESNFSLDGLEGFDMHGKTVGIIGTGRIGSVAANILHGFGCRLLAYDPYPNEQLKPLVTYVEPAALYHESDIITLHLPLSNTSRYMINNESIRQMKEGVMLINTSRGALINTREAIDGLKSGKIGYLGLDVYEEEEGLFFEDHSEDILQDDTIARLMTFRNVLITSHQAFLTDTALENIATTTIYNMDCFASGTANANEVVI